MEWKYSGVGVRSLAAGLATTGRAPEVLARCSPATREALAHPLLSAWHDGSVVVDVTLALEAELGRAGVEEVYYQAMKRSLGPFLEPFLRILMGFAGAKPGGLLGVMNQALAPLMRGVTTTWTATGADAGLLEVRYAEPIVPASEAAWQGSVRYTFDLTGVTGEVTPKPLAPSLQGFSFEVRWRPG